MSPKVMILLAGAGVVGGAILLSSRRANASPLLGESLPPTTVQQSPADLAARALAGIRAFAGARAVADNGGAGERSLINGVLSGASAKAAGGLGAAANKMLPGSGGFVQSVSGGVGSFAAGATGSLLRGAGSTVTSGLKKLKFW